MSNEIIQKVVLDAKRHEICKTDTNKPVICDGSLLIRDKTTDALMMIPDTFEIRQCFNLNLINNNSENYNTNVSSALETDFSADETNTSNIDELKLDKPNNILESCSIVLSPDFAPVKWTDDNAVRALISRWKDHENDFKNTLIRNSKVWQMIADDLKKENPLWSFTSNQCENKFKDVRKVYTKVKDHNNQSGAELKTCKFYDEMEAVLGEKPIIKPISISSTLKKRSCSKRAISSCKSECSTNSCDEKENELPSRKKSKIATEFEKWSTKQRMEAKEREQARMLRHKEKMERQDKTDNF